MAATAASGGPDPTGPAPDAPDTGTFRFRCLGHAFEAWIPADGGGRRLCVACEVGGLPYSVENREGRQSALMLLSRASAVAGTRLMLSELHRISVISTAPLPDGDGARPRLASAVAAALHAMPLIALMTECLRTPARPEAS